MPRVRDIHVKAIFDTKFDTTPFIRAASLVVDTHLLNQGLSEALLEEIELYLAAHYASARDPRFTQGNTDGQSWTVHHIDYLALALQLDSTGILAQGLSGTKRISIKVF